MCFMKFHEAQTKKEQMLKYVSVFLLTVLISTNAFSADFYGRVLTFHADPDTCITITTVWDGVDSVVIIHDTNRDLSTADTVETAPALHRTHTELNGLTANTWYYYTIQDGYVDSYTSDVDSFKTANVKGTDSDLTIWCLADTQYDSSKANERDSSAVLVNTIRARYDAGDIPHPDLIIHAGDHVQSAINQDWWGYFAIMDTLYELAAVLPCPGGHDGHGKTNTDSLGYVWHFNLPDNGVGGGTQSHHQWSLIYENIQFISLSVCDAWRNWNQDKVIEGSLQYDWADSILTALPDSIDHVIEIHGTDLIPYPWTVRNGGTDSRARPYYTGDEANYGSNDDTLRYEYLTGIRTLFVQDSVNAISIESGAYYNCGQTLENLHQYWNDCPIFQCGGMDGGTTAKGAITILRVNNNYVQAYIEKLQTWPTATEVASGYSWAKGSHQDRYYIFSAPKYNRFSGVRLGIMLGR